jgi:hypothetical protein
LTPVTTEREEMQIVSAVKAVQAFGHEMKGTEYGEMRL